MNDGSGDAVIGKVIHTVTPEPQLGQVYDVTGVVSFTNFQGNPEWNIQPRMASDVSLIVGIEEAGVLASVNLYPNPATELVNITLGDAAGQRVEYTLTNAAGRVVATDVLRDARTVIATNGLQAGFYHVTLRTSSLVRTLPLFVVR